MEFSKELVFHIFQNAFNGPFGTAAELDLPWLDKNPKPLASYNPEI